MPTQMLIQILGVVIPIFVITGIGYVWVRRDMPFDSQTISGLTMYISAPALVFHSLTALAPDIQQLTELALATLLVITGCLIIGYPIVRVLGLSTKQFLPALIQPNAGNMGLPLVLLTFGDAGIALGVVVYFVYALSQYSLGLVLASGSLNPKLLLRQPIVATSLITFGVLWSGISVPVWIANTTEILGGLMIPAMLLMLGTSIAQLVAQDLARALLVALLRLFLGVGCALLVIWWLGLSGMIAGILLLQASMPIAVFNYVFAQRYSDHPEQVAAAILVSTLLSMLLLPVLVAASLFFAGTEFPLGAPGTSGS